MCVNTKLSKNTNNLFSNTNKLLKSTQLLIHVYTMYIIYNIYNDNVYISIKKIKKIK